MISANRGRGDDVVDKEGVFASGTQALLRVLFDALREDRAAGLRTAALVSGYPGSPLGGLDIELSRERAHQHDLDLVHQPALNEELAATAVAGSQIAQTFPSPRYDGVLGVWYGKTPGLERAVDAMRHAQYAGTAKTGGVVAYCGDDVSAKSSDLPYTSEHVFESIGMPILAPGNLQEILDLGVHGVALSRYCGLWTGFKVVTAIADGAGTVIAGPGRIETETPTDAPQLSRELTGLIAGRGPAARELEVAVLRLEAARRYVVANRLNRIVVRSPAATVGVVAGGHDYHETISALEQLGLGFDSLGAAGIRLMQLQALHPFDPEVFRDFAIGLDEIIVIEEKRPRVENYIKQALYGIRHQPVIVGKADPSGGTLIPAHGALDPSKLTRPLAARLSEHVHADTIRIPRERITLPMASGDIPARPPYFCSGCPHNTSTRALDGSLVGAGTGCHAIAMFRDPSTAGNIKSIVQMGGEGAIWIGAEPFVEDDHFFQNMGDGTFFHSGQLAVQAAVAAGTHITFKLLYNSAVAMTGGQSPSMSNARPVRDVAEILIRQGVARIIITTENRKRYGRTQMPPGVELWDRSRIMEAQETLRRESGVTVLIHDQECAAELRRKRKLGRAIDPARRVLINERVCEGCGDCGVKSNCLSVEPVETEFGRKTRINQSSCNKDYSCLSGDCPSFVTVEPARRRRAHMSTTNPVPVVGMNSEPGDLPDPRTSSADPCIVRMAGIGGTGVVTVSQILGTAAMLEGKHAWGLDQTGLSQKAGPVVSDMTISAKPINGSNTASEAGTDVCLGFDLLNLVAQSNLATLSRERTTVVVSTGQTPTAMAVTDPQAQDPEAERMLAILDAHVGADRVTRLDTLELARRLFDDIAQANLMLLGVACQAGLLPVSADSIELAIERNGPRTATNCRAFRWGRAWWHDPRRVAEVTEATAEAPGEMAMVPPDLRAGDLGRVLAVRIPDLVAFQDRSYADRYVGVVRAAFEAEATGVGGSTRFSVAVAIALHKLMAYKDEYEVARLHLDELAHIRSTEAIDGPVRLRWHLHPPLLRALGLRRKLEFGPWFESVFRLLRIARRLRGTSFDPFGRAKIRMMERVLVDEYVEVIRAVAEQLNPRTLDAAVSLAGLPDMVRGYEEIKVANIARYREEMERAKRTIGIRATRAPTSQAV